MTTSDLEARIQRLEDRQAIVDVVISYATSIDRGDWDTYAALFTDPVHVDFSEAGLPAADFPRAAFTGFAQQALEAWPARQHLSPNHQVTFDEADPDRALCHSYMYAQHHAEKASAGPYIMRGSYDNHMVRTTDGWRIERLVQHLGWVEGDPNPA
jgi:3-phenylpropionate/cinnamic acid dioxygenase small subunit